MRHRSTSRSRNAGSATLAATGVGGFGPPEVAAGDNLAVFAQMRKATGFVQRRANGLALLPTVLLAVAGGVVLAVVAELILNRVTHVSTQAAAPIDVTKLAFAAVAGVGGVVGLVVAYRRQRDIEQGRFVERFGAAAAQLGDHDVAVRMAGVYAMAGTADESSGPRRQQCIDVLCGYLRLPYSPELGANHQTKFVITEPRTGDDGSSVGQQERHLEYRQNDKEVRATIVRVIASHLRDDDFSWSAYDFDFRTAHLEDVDLQRTVFGGTARFDEATFSGTSWCGGVSFSRRAGFEGATFLGDAKFGGATFSDTAAFDDARFLKRAYFKFAKFFGAAEFNRTTFDGESTNFAKTEFCRHGGFWAATFSGYVYFTDAQFFDTASFGQAEFRENAYFKRVDFGNAEITLDPKQWGRRPPEFDWDADLSRKPPNIKPQDWPPTPLREG